MTLISFGDTDFTATVNGLDFATAGTFDVINPATGEPFAKAPDIGAHHLDAIFTLAEKAFHTWKLDESARIAAMLKAADVLDANMERLAHILTSEQGKPLQDARYEVMGSSAWLRYYATLEMPPEVIRDDNEVYQEVVRRPMGVVAAITPWNVPLTLAMWKIAPALRAGNTLVVKPSQFTPLATLEMARLLRGVLPDGVLNVVTGLGSLGAAMVAHKIPRKVSFTGSTEVGRKVAIGAASDLKRVTLELGGNDAAILLSDINIAEVAPKLFLGSFHNSGQICLAAKRIYVHRSVHDELAEAVAEIARTVHVDNGLVDGAKLGPLNNKPQFERVKMLVDDAIGRGATVLSGGKPLDREGYFFAPTVLTGVDDGFKIVDEEQFGPAMPLIPFDDEQDAIDRANRSEFGLTASVWSSDSERAYAIANHLETGQVSINTHGGGVLPHLPFGGHKQSGVGVENGPWGLKAYSEVQVIAGPPRVR